MVFSSFTFLLLFLPLMVVIYYSGNSKRYRNSILMFGSLIFYAWGEPIYVLIMIFSIFNDYFHSLYIDKTRGKMFKGIPIPKILLISSITINLGILFFFKYTDFLLLNINSVLSINIPFLNLALPIGISFYTFQTMSYTIDVYREKVSVQKNIISLGTYVALFPQLIAGPIVKYIDVEKEINSDRNITLQEFAIGFKRFLFGLSKKVIIANSVATIAVFVFDELDVEDYSLLIVWAGVLAYTIQIYFDFSGYSDMAIGLGQMFGFKFPENFDYPYSATSITIFWRKWHMTLGSWFREYIYIPLGGNRVSTTKFIRNILLVWFLTGFWHGSSWNFIIWGLYFGVIMLIEKFMLNKYLEKNKYVSWFYTFMIVVMGWVLFRSSDLTQVGQVLHSMFDLTNIGNLDILRNHDIVHNTIFMVIGFVLSFPMLKKYWSIQDGNIGVAINVLVVILTLTSLSYLAFSTFNPFIYFDF